VSVPDYAAGMGIRVSDFIKNLLEPIREFNKIRQFEKKIGMLEMPEILRAYTYRAGKQCSTRDKQSTSIGENDENATIKRL